MRIADILRSKGHEVVTIAPDRTVHDALAVLVEHGIGSVVVVDGPGIAGILTERDILRLAEAAPERFARKRIADVMTADLILAEPDDEIGEIMEVMTRNRVRHLPVVDDEGLRGLVSIGDVVNALRESVQHENRHLKKYIEGSAY